MKKILTAVVLAALLALSLSACKEEGPKGMNPNFGAGNSDIYLYSDLSVRDVMIDDFDTSKYDKDEYLSYLQVELDKYNENAPFVPQTAAEGEEEGFTPHYTVPVSVASCKTENNKINQQLLYATAQDFTNYNREALEDRGGYTLQAGTLPYADASVTGAALVDPDSKDGGTVNIQDILTGRNADKYRFVICNFEAVLYGDGDVVGYTANGSFDSAKNCVTVPAGQTVIVLFR